jgi:hypothetical protein
MSRWWRSLAIGPRARALVELFRVCPLDDSKNARGLRLLKEWLSPEQRAQFDAEGQFDVCGSDTGRRYRIRYGTSANIYEVNEGGRLGAGWCFVPAGGLVAGDVMLAQKIALESSEASALAVANRLPPFRAWDARQSW